MPMRSPKLGSMRKSSSKVGSSKASTGTQHGGSSTITVSSSLAKDDPSAPPTIPFVKDIDALLLKTSSLLNECSTLFQTRQHRSCETLLHYATAGMERALMDGSLALHSDDIEIEGQTSTEDYYTKLFNLISLHATALELNGDVLSGAGAATTNGISIKPEIRRALHYYRRATQQHLYLSRMLIQRKQEGKDDETMKQGFVVASDPILASKALEGILAESKRSKSVQYNEDDKWNQVGSSIAEAGAYANPIQINLALKEVHCYLQMELYSSAYHILHGLLVQPSSRLAKPEYITFELCMQFATLCLACSRNGEAETWFLKALKKNPYCTEALEALSGVLHVQKSTVLTALEEGIHYKARMEMIGGNTSHGIERLLIPLRDMLDAMYNESENQLLTAITKYRDLLVRYPNHVQILIKIALLELYTGDYTTSAHYFTLARRVDPNIIDHMDEYAYVLSRRRVGLSELNQLAQDMLESNDSRPEPWVCLALYHHKQNVLAMSSSTSSPQSNPNTDKPLQLVDRALRLNVRHAFAHRTRGMFLLADNRAEEAVTSFFYANQIKKDVANYEGLVEAYILQGNKYKEAVCMAKEAMTIAPKDPRTFTLIGLALSHSPQTSEGGKEKAKRAFRKALLIDPYSLRPMFSLADMYLDEEEFSEAIDLLNKAAQGHGREDELDIIHAKLAEVHAAVGQYDKALSHYRTSLTMNTGNLEAQRGMERLEHLMQGQGVDQSADSQNAHGDYGDNEYHEGATNFEQDARAYL